MIVKFWKLAQATFLKSFRCDQRAFEENNSKYNRLSLFCITVLKCTFHAALQNLVLAALSML